MVTHLYTFCWNEAFIIPFFLQHYLDAVDKIIVYDNESDDRSVELLSRHPKVEVRSYSTNGMISLDIRTPIRNNMWKESRGKANWVIVIDIDEFLYYPSGLRSLLSYAALDNASLVIPQGYDMVSEKLPDQKFPILDQIRRGVASPGFSKACLFKPGSIEEINFSPGGHTAAPVGDVRLGEIPGFKLCHCKYLSYNYYASRSKVHSTRVDPHDLERGCNVHYIADDEKLKGHFDWLVSKAERVI